MTKEQELALFSMVRSNVKLSFRQVDSIIDLMKIKNSIDNDHLRTALLGLLEFVLRGSDLGPVNDIDDLTNC
ncbi:hypothetical protein [Salmonella phage FrontPhageNews]|nr:hypothetical protein [Salmonella phage FrontPhageNews]